MIQAYQDHVNTLYPEPGPNLAADPDLAPAAHDQFPLVPPVLVDRDDESSNGSDDSGYDPEGRLDMEIESDASSIVPDPDHDN